MLPEEEVPDAAAAAILAEVELQELSATPGTIAPFAASSIEWKVSGPAGFTVLLENARVAKVGEELVTPLSTRIFQLSARAGRLTQVLGAVTVNVDVTACRIAPVPNLVVEQGVREGIERLLLESPGLVRRSADVVVVDESGIEMQLAFEQKIDGSPNANVDVRAHWRYRVSNGELVEHFDVFDVSVGLPWYHSWVWAVPFAFPGVPFALAIAEDNVRVKVRQRARAGADALEAVVPFGFRILTAGFTLTNFEMLACPVTALRALLVPGAATVHATPAK